MYLDRRPTSPPFLANTCGVSIAAELTCSHGDPAFALHFLGAWDPTALRQTGTELDATLPRCVAAQLVGALGAFITHHDGDQAAEDFMDQARASFHTVLGQLRDLKTQGRDCCEAAFRSDGREHTCSPDTTPETGHA